MQCKCIDGEEAKSSGLGTATTFKLSHIDVGEVHNGIVQEVKCSGNRIGPRLCPIIDVMGQELVVERGTRISVCY